MKLKDHVARYIILSPINGEEIRFILGVNAPEDLGQQAMKWYVDNPESTVHDLALWMQGKNWGVVADYEAVSLSRPRKKA
jgi:hypothetical protein